ncbi:MAG: hypothetical protein ABIT07_02460 [Ferruginibacter sp.]
MRSIILVCFVAISLIIFLGSCARGITTYEAANGKARCGRYIR